jgi:hypothetical protein
MGWFLLQIAAMLVARLEAEVTKVFIDVQRID